MASRDVLRNFTGHIGTFSTEGGGGGSVCVCVCVCVALNLFWHGTVCVCVGTVWNTCMCVSVCVCPRYIRIVCVCVCLFVCVCVWVGGEFVPRPSSRVNSREFGQNWSKTAPAVCFWTSFDCTVLLSDQVPNERDGGAAMRGRGD
jgi:hypothetical protein